MIILFDLDGTIIDDSERNIEAFEKTLKKYNIMGWRHGEMRELIGIPIERIFSMISPYGEDMKREYEKIYTSISTTKDVVLPGIESLLKFLDEKGIRKGVVTSRDGEVAKKLLKNLRLDFDCVIGFSENSNPKPSGDPIIHAMKLTGEDSALYVGDTNIDRTSAGNAHIPFIGVSWGIDGENIKAKKIVNSVEGLLAEIKEILNLRKPIKQGAEAKLYEDEFLGRKCVIKDRIEKGYREKTLDKQLRTHRTREEARLMHDARKSGVPTPHIYDVHSSAIVMEFIEGERVKEILESERGGVEKLCCEIGRCVGKLHKSSIIHGDLTTSNMIVRDGKLHLIDFGLGEKSDEVERKGVDLHVLHEVLKATGKEYLFSSVLRGYGETCEGSREVEKRIKEISKRGRYAT